MEGKNLLLLREMLESTGYPDRALVGDIESGFRTSGDLPPTGAFPPKEGPATRTVRDVLAEARRAQRFVFAEGRGGSGDETLDRELHRITYEEEALGWLSPPPFGQGARGPAGPALGPGPTLAALCLYLLAFGPGLGPLPWTINSELHPPWCRASSIALATTTNWLANLLVSATCRGSESPMPSGCFYGLARHRGGQEVAVLYQVEGGVLVLVLVLVLALMLFIIRGVFFYWSP